MQWRHKNQSNAHRSRDARSCVCTMSIAMHTAQETQNLASLRLSVPPFTRVTRLLEYLGVKSSVEYLAVAFQLYPDSIVPTFREGIRKAYD